MNWCRNGFMRCNNREEPCGSHHDEARVLKWETSVALTELCEDEEGAAEALVLYVAYERNGVTFAKCVAETARERWRAIVRRGGGRASRRRAILLAAMTAMGVGGV